MARMAELTRGTCCAWLTGFFARSAPRTASKIAVRCSGVVPQHPPTMRTPKSFTNSDSAVAIGAGSSGYTASPTPVLSGSPAFGITDSGRVACSDRYLTGSRMCSGPCEEIKADHVDLERLERRHRTRDVGPEQHPAAHIERHLSLQRQPPSNFCEQSLDARDGCLYLENIL